MTELATAAPEAVIDAPQSAPAVPTPEATSFKDDSVRIRTEREQEMREEASLDSKLRAVFEKAQKAKAEPAAEAAEPPIRDASGKFQAKEPAVSKDSAPKAEGKDQQPNEAPKQEAATEKPAAKPAIARPNSWSAEHDQVWSKIPDDAKEYVAKREAEVHKEISKLGQFAKDMAPSAKLLQEYRESFERRGMSFDQGLKQLLEAQRKLDTDPKAAIEQMAKYYNVKLGADQEADNLFGPDPEVESLKAELTNLKQYIQKIGGTISQQEQHARQSKLDEVTRIISEFSADKPDFADLEQDIQAHWQAADPSLSPRERLAKAYEAAQWANPVSRAKLLSKLNSEAESKRAEAAKKAADDARRASQLNIEGSDSPSATSGDIDAELMGIWRKRQAA